VRADHIAVRQLEPRAANASVNWSGFSQKRLEIFRSGVEPQGKVSGQHGWPVALRRVVGIRNRAGACATLRLPLMRTGRALRQFPFVAEQDPEEVIAPLRWRVGPSDLQAAGDRVTAFAGARAALPTEPCSSMPAASGSGPTWDAGPARGFAEGVTTRDERNRLFVVHGHASESLADILGRRDRIRVAVRAFRVDVDQPHLHGSERIFEVPVAGVAFVIQPLVPEPSRRLLPAPRHPHDRRRSRRS